MIDKYKYMVTHFKSGESDGPFATYKEAKAHYDSHDEEWREAHYIEGVRMIDTDKYEGHTREEWRRDSNDLWFHRNGKDTQIADILIRGDGDERYYEDVANARLITDAPLLLAKVKQAREIVPKLSRLIGVEIPWIQDDYHDIFVGKTIEWNYDDSGEWVLVNHNESRWVAMSYIEVYNVSEYREQVGLKMIDLSETKPVYEIHIWNDKTKQPLGEFDAWYKLDNKDEALEAYHKLDCAYKILMEYAGDDGDVLLEYSRGD